MTKAEILSRLKNIRALLPDGPPLGAAADLSNVITILTADLAGECPEPVMSLVDEGRPDESLVAIPRSPEPSEGQVETGARIANLERDIEELRKIAGWYEDSLKVVKERVSGAWVPFSSRQQLEAQGREIALMRDQIKTLGETVNTLSLRLKDASEALGGAHPPKA